MFDKRIEPLNKDVADELRHNFELWLIFSALYHGTGYDWYHCTGYDWEIQPLHNPDWVRSQALYEVRLLASAKQKLEIYRKTFEKLTNVTLNYEI